MEINNQKSISEIRKEVARKLYDCGLSKSTIVKVLKLSQPTLSRYLKDYTASDTASENLCNIDCEIADVDEDITKHYIYRRIE